MPTEGKEKAPSYKKLNGQVLCREPQGFGAMTKRTANGFEYGACSAGKFTSSKFACHRSGRSGILNRTSKEDLTIRRGHPHRRNSALQWKGKQSLAQGAVRHRSRKISNARVGPTCLNPQRQQRP